MSEIENRTDEELTKKLEQLVDKMSDECNYSSGGLYAVHCYLINKHHWLPADVIKMTPIELTIALLHEFNETPEI